MISLERGGGVIWSCYLLILGSQFQVHFPCSSHDVHGRMWFVGCILCWTRLACNWRQDHRNPGLVMLVSVSDDRTYTTTSRFPKIFWSLLHPGCEGTDTFRAPAIPELQYMIPDSNDDLKISTCLDWWNEGVHILECEEETAVGSRDTYWENINEIYERILFQPWLLQRWNLLYSSSTVRGWASPPWMTWGQDSQNV